MNGPRKNLTPLDMMMMNRASMQGGVMNFLGKQPEVTAPIRAQSHADSPPVELAYITDAEKDLLVKANIHGSMAGKPNPGPAGIASLDDFFSTPGGGIGGGSTADAGPDRKTTVYDQGQGTITSIQPALGGGGGGTSAEDFGIQPGMAVSDSGQVFQGTDFVPAPGQADRPGTFVPVSDTRQKQLEEANRLRTKALQDDLNRRLGIVTQDKFGVLQPLVDDATSKFRNFAGLFPTFSTFQNLTKEIRPTVESFNDPNFLATMRNEFKTQKEFNDYVDEYKELLDEAYAGQGDVGDEFRDRMESAYNLATTGELGSDLQIRTNPTGYYTEKDDEGNIKVANVPQTSGQALTMAENLTFADIENSNLSKTEKRRLGAALMEARALAMDRQTTTDAQGQMVASKPMLPMPLPGPMPGPGPVPRPGPIEPPVLPTPTPFPGTGIIGAVTDPRFVGPSFPGVTTAQNYFNQGIADPRFQRFFQIANQFPTTT
jgi:hypothetical protein